MGGGMERNHCTMCELAYQAILDTLLLLHDSATNIKICSKIARINSNSYCQAPSSCINKQKTLLFLYHRVSNKEVSQRIQSAVYGMQNKEKRRAMLRYLIEKKQSMAANAQATRTPSKQPESARWLQEIATRA
jgi:hypothetical protein